MRLFRHPKLRLVASNRRNPARRRHYGKTSSSGVKASVGVLFAAMAIGGSVIFGNAENTGVDPTELFSVSKDTTDARPSPEITSARSMPVCRNARRVNCVVDGDTFWLDGVKYRISNIDTPELKGNCAKERQIAGKARDRLASLMDQSPIRIQIDGTDAYGRRLAKVSGPGGDIGDRLASEGLAEVWGGSFINWCQG
jgi:micrococcal nuclease